MPQRIPNLWRMNEDAIRLYELYLCQLRMNHLHSRVVQACRQIRRFAARGPGAQEGLFTFHFEIGKEKGVKKKKQKRKRGQKKKKGSG